MLASSGDSGPPCGVPSSLAITTPSTIAPRRKNFPINPSTLLSRMVVPSRPIRMSWLTWSKETTTHYPPSALSGTGDHHPSVGQSLEVLRQARMPTGLQLVLILPDGSKSLIPAKWTDFNSPPGPPHESPLVGSLDDLLRLRGLTDALLRRSADLPVR